MHQHDNPPPEDEPHGILMLCDPRFAHLISEEDKFERAMERAWKTGRLFVQEEPTLQ
jgi:hypothetical protein